MKKAGTIIAAGLAGWFAGCVYMLYRCGTILDEKQSRLDKFQNYFNVLNLWMKCKENHYDLRGALLQKNIHTVAIYGMGELGRRFKYELEQAGVEVAYVIDVMDITMDITRYRPKDRLPAVDVIIVTPVHEYEKIKGEILQNNSQLQVVSLGTVLNWGGQ